MARVSSDLRLNERSARTRLPVRSNPYWRMICEGLHLGYYRGARGGTWIVRYRAPGLPGNGAKCALGAADDVAPADGTSILSWKNALDKAMHWFELQVKGEVARSVGAAGYSRANDTLFSSGRGSDRISPRLSRAGISN